MKKANPKLKYQRLLLLVILSFHNVFVLAEVPPFIVKPGMYSQLKTNDLGLNKAEGVETVTIFQPSDSTDKFTNGVVMTTFKNKLYCQWQSSATDEDAQDTWVAYTYSEDGVNWQTPNVLEASIPDGYCSSGGWWATNDTLVGYINVWPSSVSPRGGYTCYKTSVDGVNWSELKPLLMANGDTLKGIFEQDPHALPNGRIINAAHFQPGLRIAPVYTDDVTGIRGWVRANYSNISFDGGLSREIEPSWFFRSDDTLVMTFRDQSSSFKRLAALSGDNGENWTTAVLTDMPDARTKQSAGNLPDSTAFMAGNPVNNKLRLPLAVTLGRDGYFFNTAYLLRASDELQDLRYSGKAKRAGYHYPKSMVYNGYLYVSYASNKEDAEYTKVPLSSLVLDTSTVASLIDTTSVLNAIPLINNNDFIDIKFLSDQVISISLYDYYNEGTASIYNLNGKLIKRSKITYKEIEVDMKLHPQGNYVVVVQTKGISSSKLFYKP